jgi:hypothetical protein
LGGTKEGDRCQKEQGAAQPQVRDDLFLSSIWGPHFTRMYSVDRTAGRTAQF